MSCAGCGGYGTLDDCASAREIPCPDCDGEGVVYEEVAGGRWNPGLGTWEPDERRVSCDRCGGRGDVDVDELTPAEAEALGIELEDAA